MTTPDSGTTPQQAFQILTTELSGSGSQPLLDAKGNKLTLRGAIGAILNKVVSSVFTLASRPLPPTQADDLYGHIMSLRAEGLITQAIVTDLAAALGRDVATLRANVIAELNSTTTTTS